MSETSQVALSPPLVPRIVTFDVPGAAAAATEKSTVLAPLVEAGLKVAVTPLGRPSALSATSPENPSMDSTVTALLPRPP